MLEKILEAIERKDINEIKRLMEAGADFTRSDNKGLTPVDWARRTGDPDVVDIVDEIAAEQEAVKQMAPPPQHLPQPELDQINEQYRNARRGKNRDAARTARRELTEASHREHSPLPDLGRED